jgi:hypothetical protein
MFRLQLHLKKSDFKKVANDAATILSKKEVPILCYHNIRDFKPSQVEM